MRRYNIALLILTIIPFAFTAPVQIQEKRQPEDTISVLGKRILEENFNVLWDGWWHYLNVLGEAPPPPQLLRPNAVGVHVPPQVPAGSDRGPTKLGGGALSGAQPPQRPESSSGSYSDR